MAGLGLVAPSFTRRESNVTAPSQTMGTVVTASATPHTKGSYTELIASTGFEACWIEIGFGEVRNSGVDTATLVDIAIGAAASEQVIIPNLNACAATTNITLAIPSVRYHFPLLIPAGERISARSQALAVSDTVRVSVKLYGAPTEPVWAGQQVIDYGTNLAASRGVSVAAGLSAAEGSWTEIVSATTQDHSYLIAGVGMAGDISHQESSNLIDLGIGAATEVAIAEDFPFLMTASEALVYPFPAYAWSRIPSGTRLVARISSHQANAQSYDVILYGLS